MKEVLVVDIPLFAGLEVVQHTANKSEGIEKGSKGTVKHVDIVNDQLAVMVEFCNASVIYTGKDVNDNIHPAPTEANMVRIVDYLKQSEFIAPDKDKPLKKSLFRNLSNIRTAEQIVDLLHKKGHGKEDAMAIMALVSLALER